MTESLRKLIDSYIDEYYGQDIMKRMYITANNEFKEMVILLIDFEKKVKELETQNTILFEDDEDLYMYVLTILYRNRMLTNGNR